MIVYVGSFSGVATTLLFRKGTAGEEPARFPFEKHVEGGNCCAPFSLSPHSLRFIEGSKSSVPRSIITCSSRALGFGPEMEPIASALDTIKGFVQSGEQFVKGAFQRCFDPHRKNPVRTTLFLLFSLNQTLIVVFLGISDTKIFAFKRSASISKISFGVQWFCGGIHASSSSLSLLGLLSHTGLPGKYTISSLQCIK